MTGERNPEFVQGAGSRRKILLRLWVLRLFALICAAGVIFFFRFYLQRTLPYSILYIVLAVALGYCLLTWLRLRRSTPVTDQELLIQVLLDVGLVILLVSMSGRSTNPFIYYLLVLVGIGATLFSRKVSWSLVALVVTAYTTLLYLDLQTHIHRDFNDFHLHLVGMWVNFVGSATVLNLFVSTLSTALRDREIRLARAREETLNNEQLIGIGTLAASTVHALGTPLSTMAIVLGEMQHEALDDKPRVALLLAQIQRCKQTLGRLSQLADRPGRDAGWITLQECLAELEEHYHLLNPRLMPEFHCATNARGCRITDSFLLQYALVNLIDNAVRAASSGVVVQSCLEEPTGRVLFFIEDDGPGIPPEYADDFGRPAFARTTAGLGIGVFLANSTIERLDGEIILYNPEASGTGKTTVVVKLPIVAGVEAREESTHE